MQEFLGQVFDHADLVPWPTFMGRLLLRLVAALILSFGVVGIYWNTRRSASLTSTFPATLVLLCLLIAAVTQVIGDNIARAFSLVGALSVVRFRTVVRDTKDTAFVILAVVVGMATGLGQLEVAVVGLLIVGFAAWLFRDVAPEAHLATREMELTVKLAWSADLETRMLDALSRHVRDIEPTSAGTVKNGVGMELVYHLRLLARQSLTEVISELSRIEGIQSVELKAIGDD